MFHGRASDPTGAIIDLFASKSFAVRHLCPPTSRREVHTERLVTSRGFFSTRLDHRLNWSHTLTSPPSSH